MAADTRRVVQEFTITANGRYPIQRSSDVREALTEITQWNGDSTATLGTSGVCRLQVSFEARPSLTNDDHWQDFADKDGNFITIALGRTYGIESKTPNLALNMTSSTTAPNLPIKVT